MTEYGVDALAFGPHPDDVELFAGGTMIRLAELGYRTGAIDLSLGELSSHGTVEERQREAEAAGRILRLGFRENLELPDGGIDPNDREQAARVLTALRRHRPELVLVPWFEERHPDHEAAARLITRALFFAGVGKLSPDQPRFVPRQVLYYQLRHRFSPSFIVDISACAAEKRRAIEAHRSQVTRRSDDAETLVSSPLAIDAIEARDRFYGSMIGTRAGEPIRCRNTLGIRDPLAHFRDNPFSEAHAFEALE